MTAGADVDVWGQLAVNLGSVAAELRADRERKRQLAAGIWWLEAPALPLSPLPAFNSQIGPNGGYAWAVQRITVGPVGAATDLPTVYKGRSANEVQPQNALFTFNAGQNSAAGSFQTWHPGGKGLVLMPDESIIVAGTITGANPMLSWDVVQVELDNLSYYLL